MIICIEGITNSGKSTLCKMIEYRKHYLLANKHQKNFLVSQKVKELTNPITNLNCFDKTTEFFLYNTLLSEKSFAVLQLGNNVLIDRFSLSVYSYFKAKYHFPDDYLISTIKCASREIIPDVTFFLDVSLDTIINRSKTSPFSRKDMGIETYYKALRDCYLDNLSVFSKKSFVIAADKMTVDDIYAFICKLIGW